MSAQINPSSAGLSLKASAYNFALQDATPTIATWTAPNDGKPHRFEAYTSLNVATTLVGGEIDINFTIPNGTATSQAIYNANQTAGQPWPNDTVSRIIEPGSTVTITQTAITSGAGTLWAEIWGM